ncbi:MAG: aminoacyl-tRNA deacylase [Dehalococcoidia bacterium]|nr:aminoacyl-tRNA deacylase [Dehalococcoidia bacterium]
MANRPIVARMLEQRRVPFELFEFDAAIRSAEEVARSTGMAPHEVYKTLVVEHDPPRGKPLLVMMPADSELDLKALAAALGAKKLRMASHADAERYTGLQVGGISALALLQKGFPVHIDARALELDQVLVSAGQRGADVRLAVRDLLVLTKAAPLAGIAAAR